MPHPPSCQHTPQKHWWLSLGQGEHQTHPRTARRCCWDLLGVPAPTLRCLLSPLVLHDTSSRPLMPSQAHPGLLDNFEDWQLIFAVLQSLSVLEDSLPSTLLCHFRAAAVPTSKAESLPTYKAGCDLPSWKSFTVSGDELRNWVNTSLGTVLEAFAAPHPVLLPRSLLQPWQPQALSPSPRWRLCLLLEPAPQLQSLLPAEKERVT